MHLGTRDVSHETLVLQYMRQVGNVKSNGTYNPNEVRHPPPTNMIDAERDSDLEKFIRGRWSLLSRKANRNRH